MTAFGRLAGWSARYEASVMQTYGLPKRLLVRGEGCYVWDEDGDRYLDLLAGIAVNSLGHAHPSLVAAVTEQIGVLSHTSNFFATAPQIALAERLLTLSSVGSNGRVFFCNSGAEAIEAAFKIARKTGKRKLLAARGSFHGRTMGALALTGQPTKRVPFAPLPPEVVFIDYGNEAALSAEIDEDTAAVFLEPVQGEGGVVPPPPGYLAAAREMTAARDALLVVDEIQTGIGRTGRWFAYQREGIAPDVITVAKGLAGGIPIGACIGIGAAATLLAKGEHGSTFGGNPLACAAALAVLDTIERGGLVDSAAKVGEHLAAAIEALAHPLVTGIRGSGLLIGITLAQPVAARATAAALDAGYIVNDVAPDVIRLAPPLILTTAQVDEFAAALPAILDAAVPSVSLSTATHSLSSPLEQQ
ncbi:MAG TPA: acetylornithine transaminase [Actinomycetes bacterium]|jgi:acetylornithine aminotransferase